MSIEHLLNARATITRRSATDDGGGGTSSVWVPIGTLPCRRSQPSATERVLAAASGADLDHAVYFAASADVQRGDRLTVDGLALEVTAVYQPSAPAYLRADCRQRQREEPL